MNAYCTIGTSGISPRAEQHRAEMRLHGPRLRDLVCLFQGVRDVSSSA